LLLRFGDKLSVCLCVFRAPLQLLLFCQVSTRIMIFITTLVLYFGQENG
jgi:hypothetical protein